MPRELRTQMRGGGPAPVELVAILVGANRLAVRHVNAHDARVADRCGQNALLLVLEPGNAGHDVSNLQGWAREDRDAVVGALACEMRQVARIGKRIAWKLRVLDLGFLQTHDVRRVVGQPLDETRQPHRQRIDVPGDQLQSGSVTERKWAMIALAQHERTRSSGPECYSIPRGARLPDGWFARRPYPSVECRGGRFFHKQAAIPHRKTRTGEKRSSSDRLNEPGLVRARGSKRARRPQGSLGRQRGTCTRTSGELAGAAIAVRRSLSWRGHGPRRSSSRRWCARSTCVLSSGRWSSTSASTSVRSARRLPNSGCAAISSCPSSRSCRTLPHHAITCGSSFALPSRASDPTSCWCKAIR